MAEVENEADVIRHLIEVEKQASALISEASAEAEKRLAKARAQYNAEFKTQCDEVVRTLEAGFQSKIEDSKARHAKQLEEYKASLSAREQNTAAFRSFLDGVLVKA